MTPGAGIFLRIDREVRGPCDLATIRRLAENGVISRETEAAWSADGPWGPLGTFVEAAAFLPARRELGFRPSEFEVINSGDSASDDLRDVIASAKREGRVLRPSHPPELAAHFAAKAAAPPNEVEAMVREVQEREAQFAPPPPPPPKRRIKRRVQFIVTLAVVCNGGLLAIPTCYGAWGDFWSMLVFKAWFLILNGGLVIAYFALPNE